jgi:hypothetical protein
MGRLD